MNKYEEALSTISCTLAYYVVCKDLELLPSDNEIYEAMATLRELVNKEKLKEQ